MPLYEVRWQEVYNVYSLVEAASEDDAYIAQYNGEYVQEPTSEYSHMVDDSTKAKYVGNTLCLECGKVTDNDVLCDECLEWINEEMRWFDAMMQELE